MRMMEGPCPGEQALQHPSLAATGDYVAACHIPWMVIVCVQSCTLLWPEHCIAGQLLTMS